MMKISMEEYQACSEEYMGYCLDCQDFTAHQVEPDARNYECPKCGELRVFGAEEAMMMGDVVIAEEGE